MVLTLFCLSSDVAQIRMVKVIWARGGEIVESVCRLRRVTKNGALSIAFIPARMSQTSDAEIH